MYSDTFSAMLPNVYIQELPMRRETNTPQSYQDIITFIRVPNKTVTDNKKVLIDCIENGLTVPRHRQQHCAEGIVSNFGFAGTKLYFKMPLMKHMRINILALVQLIKYADKYLRKHSIGDVVMRLLRVRLETLVSSDFPDLYQCGLMTHHFPPI